jgi:hypothetical protein
VQNSTSRFHSGLYYQLAAALIFVTALILINPNVESGMNDDWSFIFTARELATSGHVRYNAWSSPLIGFQAYWAALFFKLFGFSFWIARASVWTMAILSIPVLWRILKYLPLTQSQALFGIVFLLLSPVVLPHVTTFMTDLPAFFLFATALLCALEAWSSDNDKSALLWICALTGCGILSGSVRQIYWVTGICFLTVLSVKRIRSAPGRILIALCTLLTLAFGYAASRWLAHQPYVPVEDSLQQLLQMGWPELLHGGIGEPLRDFIGLSVLCIPLTLPLAWSQFRRTPIWLHFIILAASIALPIRLAQPMPWIGNTITNYGIILSGTVSLGGKPVLLSAFLMLVLAALGIASMAYAVKTLKLPTNIPLRRFLLLTVPFLLLYTVVLCLRSPGFGIFDRYLIPHLFIVTALLLAVNPKQLSTVTLATSVVFIMYSLATTHDYFAEARARLEATNEVRSAGHPRTEIISSFEYDAWSQLELTGHVNNEHVLYPPTAYQQTDDCTGPDETQAWWRTLEPAIAARFVITLSPLDGLQPSPFPPVSYNRWLPPGRYQILIQQVDKQSPALTCQFDPNEQ